MRKTEAGLVDSVMLTTNKDGHKYAKVKIRNTRVPQIGMFIVLLSFIYFSKILSVFRRQVRVSTRSERYYRNDLSPRRFTVYLRGNILFLKICLFIIVNFFVLGCLS